MLSHVEVTARVTVTPAAHFVWSNRLDFTHDCLVCLRVGRIIQLQHGMPYALCTGNEHPAAMRVSAFDATEQGAERRLRCRITSWWAPFNDQMEPDVQASELTAQPWVRLNYRVGCHTCRDNGVGEWLGIEGHLSSDTAPVTSSCPRCGTELITGAAPEINLVG
ncbi:hypothetical protein SAMN04488564_110237 [Lentzea waywayandensis]|uniref:Uncharacterized protein n=1 Tax=Lentzea waywayandensis TaxID=84724 RepID=A0A1I6FAF9_9PSEU|nr:hypothetical protein [Lentzea waywayandensis]SFR26918.1 hypothetical protein SAMN04488564_110237 [Lentzea waywayandensis]